MLKHTMDKGYYYEVMDKLEELGFSCEYILNAFSQAMSGDELEELLNFFIKTHDLEDDFKDDEDDDEDVNGFSNRDTWLIHLYLDNDRVNYFKYINDLERLLDLDDDELIKELKSYNYHDSIDFNNVNVNEIRAFMLEDYEGVFNE